VSDDDFPLLVLAVMCAVPFATAVIVPPEVGTDAIVDASDVHVTLAATTAPELFFTVADTDCVA
jgi:hypothetical protein